MSAAIHAEWTKLRTVAGPGWLLLAATVLTLGLSVLATAAAKCPVEGCVVDTAKTSLTGFQLGQAVVAVLAVLAVGGEYSTGMMSTTLAAMPRRSAVVAAKAAVVGVPVLAVGLVGALGGTLAGRLILPRHGFTAARGFPPLSLADGPTLRAAGGSVLYLALIALLGLGIAMLIRDSAAAIGAVLGLLYMFPIVTAIVTDPHWKRHLQQIGPSGAGLAVQSTIDLHGLPIGPWPGLGVLALWAAGALLAGGLALRLRDA
jgi:ABC-2 type transport system permease protein